MDMAGCFDEIALDVVAGTSFEEVITLLEDGSPMSLAGATARFEVAPWPGAEPGYSYSASPLVIVGSPNANDVSINIPPGLTRLWQREGQDQRFIMKNDEEWLWRLVLEWAGGSRTAAASGRLNVCKELVAP